MNKQIFCGGAGVRLAAALLAVFWPMLPFGRVGSLTAHDSAVLQTADGRWAERELASEPLLREVLARNPDDPKRRAPLAELLANPLFQRKFYGFAVTLYQSGQKSIRHIAAAGDESQDIARALEKIRANPTFGDFKASDGDRCRIQIDFLLEKPRPFDLMRTREDGVEEARFEVGVDGILARKELGDGNVRDEYFLPGDAYVRSMNLISQIKRLIEKRTDTAFEDLLCSRFLTDSFVSFGGRWVPLYRGHPITARPGPAQLRRAAAEAAGYLIRHQQKDGRYLYYYNAAKDSFVDHEHPRRDPKKNPYYNELRHAGGTILLMEYFESTADRTALESARKALDWLVAQTSAYKLQDGRTARRVYFNKKSKLGGAGLALYALCKYRQLTGDNRYHEPAVQVTRHLLNQIQPSGEFFYYDVYLDMPVSPEQNARLFNFYYPGEAVVGLAAHLKWGSPDPALAAEIKEDLKRALKFLFEERPRIYAGAFGTLPADSWLMMGVLELWDFEEFRLPSGRDFVFGDADTMLRMMYREADALYPDYIGAFFYRRGDPPYPDGARCEGLVAALALAARIGDEERVRQYTEGLELAAWATLRLMNTPESVYFAPNRERSVWGIRFKPTRQWFRVDTIAHPASFYLRFLRFWTPEPVAAASGGIGTSAPKQPQNP